MNKEDFQRLAKETGIKETTLRARWAKGWRGKELTQPILSKSAYSRKGRLNSPWHKQSPAIIKK